MNIGKSRIAFLFFFIVACLGTLLRSPWIGELPLSYTHLIHAHSHTAFQGWIYLALFILTTKLFLTKEQIRNRRYVLQFYITSVVIVGIFISFSLQGYALFSILFSSIFQLLNYWFFRSVLLDTREEYRRKKPISLKFIYAGIVLGILSTLAPIAIGILSAKGYKGTELYESVIYYFLHFQYNGWFLFTSLGVFFRSMEQKSISIHNRQVNLFYRLMLVSVFPALTLSYLGMSFRTQIFPFAVMAVALEGFAIFIFIKIILKHYKNWFGKISRIGRLFFQLTFLALLIKTAISLVSLHPFFMEIAFQNRLSVVFFLHLVLIGVLSFHIIAQYFMHRWIADHFLSRLGGFLLICGFVLTEFVLALGGVGLFYNQSFMLYGSMFMTLGIALLGMHVRRRELAF